MCIGIMCRNSHGNIIPNNQNLKVVQMSVSSKIDQLCVYTMNHHISLKINKTAMYKKMNFTLLSERNQTQDIFYVLKTAKAT